MYIFETNSKQPVSTFLQDVHDAMKMRYYAQSLQDKSRAKILQTFLQNLKQVAESQDKFTDSVANAVLTQLQASHRSNYKIENLFRRKGGQNLENELADIVLATYNASGFNLDKSQTKVISAGQQTGTVLQSILDDDVQTILSELHKNVAKAIDQKGKTTTNISNGMILTDVQQKTDIQGLKFNIPISFNLTYDLPSILQILNEAKISAKNYSSYNKAGEMIDDLYDINIGDSNPYRAIAGSLASLGYGDQTIRSAFYASYAKAKEDINVRAHIYHLRYIYELTGAGSVNRKTNQMENANFLVYNDPTGTQIFVVSAGELLSEVLNNNNLFISENPFAAITLKKSYFKNKT